MPAQYGSWTIRQFAVTNAAWTAIVVPVDSTQQGCNQVIVRCDTGDMLIGNPLDVTQQDTLSAGMQEVIGSPDGSVANFPAHPTGGPVRFGPSQTVTSVMMSVNATGTAIVRFLR